MPKTNDQTGATAAGFSGIVEHAAPIDNGTKLSELDPELNLDGTLIDGEHPDHPAGESRDFVAPTGAPEAIERGDGESDTEPDGGQERERPAPAPAEPGRTGPVTDPAKRDESGEKKEETPSVGINSRTSTAKTTHSRGKNNATA